MVTRMGQELKAAAAEVEALKLTPEFRAAYREVLKGLRSSVEYAILAGDILRKIKDKVGHGGFTPFVEKYLSVTQRTCTGWMNLSVIAENMGKRKLTSVLNKDPTILQLVSYGKFSSREEAASFQTGGVVEEPETTESDDSMTVDEAAETTDDVEEIEVEDWQYNATYHQSLVDALNAFGRFLTEVMGSDGTSEYIRHIEGRLRLDMKQRIERGTYSFHLAMPLMPVFSVDVAFQPVTPGRFGEGRFLSTSQAVLRRPRGWRLLGDDQTIGLTDVG